MCPLPNSISSYTFFAPGSNDAFIKLPESGYTCKYGDFTNSTKRIDFSTVFINGVSIVSNPRRIPF